jgi:hypothetical protein
LRASVSDTVRDALDDVASTVPVHYAVDDVATGEHLYTMRWMTLQAPVSSTVRDALDDVAGTCTLRGG